LGGSLACTNMASSMVFVSTMSGLQFVVALDVWGHEKKVQYLHCLVGHLEINVNLW
jgi:hypothetical protein